MNANLRQPPIIVKACSHCEGDVDAQLRRKRIAGGGAQLVFQCLECGRRIGSAIPHHTVEDVGSLPEWDESFEERRNDEITQKREAFELKRRLRAERYEGYLQSPEWHRKRSAVLKRDAGVCQGCQIAPATVVHHISYEHIFDELLFELTSLCAHCHERCHRVPSETEISR